MLVLRISKHIKTIHLCLLLHNTRYVDCSKEMFDTDQLMFLPADDHSTENWCPASVQYIMSIGIGVCDVDPQRKNKKETKADDRCDPVMCAGFRICIKKPST